MSNQTLLYTSMNSFEITPMYFFVNMLIILASLLAIILNAGIIYIFLVEKDFDQDISCILIKHLAFSDLFCAVVIIYNVVYNLVHYKILAECLIRFGLLNGISLNSSMIICALTVDRYVKIIAPYKYVQLFTASKALKSVVVNWFICVPLCLFPSLGWSKIQTSNYCSYFGIFPRPYLVGFATLILMSVFVVLFLYIHIIKVSVQLNVDIFLQKKPVVSKGHRNVWWRPAKTTLIIVGTNIITVVPPSVYILIASSGLSGWTDGEKGTVLLYTCAASYLNMIFNPIIYAARIQRIQRCVRRLLNLPNKSEFISEYELQHVEMHNSNNNNTNTNTNTCIISNSNTIIGLGSRITMYNHT